MPSVIDPAIFFIITVGAVAFLVASLLLGGHHGAHHAGHGSGHGAGHPGQAGGTARSGQGNASHSHAGHGHATHARSGDTARLQDEGHSSSAPRAERFMRGNISPFSLQTLLLFMAGIGVGGYFADVFIAATLAGVLAIAVAAGLAFSGAGYGLLNYLYRQQGSSQTLSMFDAIGATGIVLVGIPDGGRGKVSCRVGGKSETFSAESADGKSISLNSAIKISSVAGSTVVVAQIEPEEEAKLLPWRSTDA
ncbi:MAG TPA: NfeD family protein [Blastocatellia bacterium]|nr:NfeD family protein [Blastocatellia bacterium]